MSIKLIPLSRLEADPRGTLTECLDSGQSLVVELPDHRLVSIQGLEPGDDDDLIDRLLESNPSFRALVEKMKVTAYEATVHNGQIKVAGAVRLPENARVFVVVPDADGATVLHVGSPRLAQPERAADFTMEVSEEPRNDTLR